MTDLELVKELVRKTCRCGAAKKAHQTFCLRCYQSLPGMMQRALYARLGKGYREAYHQAAEFLDTERSVG